MSKPKIDKELEQYRQLLETPDSYEDGFGWTTLAGILFCGLIMMPGAIYLGLMTGGSMGSAATWVTVILFSEVARRAMKTMSKGNLVVLLHAASVMMAGSMLFPGGPFGNVIYRAYLVTSDAARDMGMRDAFPTWWCPKPDSPAITERLLWHKDWLMPILLLAFISLVGFINKYTLGYFFFRMCSDVEQLPFPMAPISAQGALALAESNRKEEELEAEEEKRDAEGRKVYSKWRVFSLGALIGIAFGVIQVGVPAISGLFLDKPFFLIPQPFLDTTTMTEGLLPATPTGLVIDPGIIILGMVLPFWAVIGTFGAILATIIGNPILHHFDFLTQWQPGMNTINTSFVNGVDFWMSFGFGTSAAIALISIFATVKDVVRRSREARRNRLARNHGETNAREEVASLWKTPKIGRGDYPMWLALAGYVLASGSMVFVCNRLVPGILGFLIVFAYIYNPFISYVNARLLGLTGQAVEIPFVREGAFILSGCQKVDIWLAPVPIENYGYMAQAFRVNELTGVNFRSLIKADLVAIPCLFILSFFFWAFIWHSNAVPSEIYPAAQLNWELAAKQNTLMFSSTFRPQAEDGIATAQTFADTEFAKALHPKIIVSGGVLTLILFTVFTIASLPTLFIYGMIRGFGQLPHVMLLEIVGAVLGRYYFQKKFGASNFLRMVPAVLAGYYTGVGLIGMATVAMNLIKNAVSSAPF
jgi:hypothetical protein